MNKKGSVIVVFVIMAAAIIFIAGAGGGVYYWQNSLVEQAKDDTKEEEKKSQSLEQSIVELQSEKKEMEKEVEIPEAVLSRSIDLGKESDNCLIPSDSQSNKIEYNEYVSFYSLTKSGLNTFLRMAGIKQICVPKEFESMSLWDNWKTQDTAEYGQRKSVSFSEVGDEEGRYVSIFYQTYNFSVGSEYIIHAREGDYNLIRNSEKENAVEVNGIKGFKLYRDYGLGFNSVHMAYVFPFEDHYVAIGYNLSDENSKNSDQIISNLKNEKYPEDEEKYIGYFEKLVQSIKLIQ